MRISSAINFQPAATLLLLASSPQHQRRAIQCGMSMDNAFEVSVDLGDGSGEAQCELEPYFSDSALVTLRVPLPFELEAEPIQGVYKVVKPGYGLLEGDVLRAFSTFAIRYDSQLKEVRAGPGLPGMGEGDKSPVEKKREAAASFFLGGIEKLLGVGALSEVGAFAETRPAKCLFVADGQPHSAVEDALVANVPDKTREIVMIFERPYT